MPMMFGVLFVCLCVFGCVCVWRWLCVCEREQERTSSSGVIHELVQRMCETHTHTHTRKDKEGYYIRKKSEKASSRERSLIICVLLCTSVLYVCVLSVAPHQEPRFLLPLLIPMCVTFGWALQSYWWLKVSHYLLIALVFIYLFFLINVIVVVVYCDEWNIYILSVLCVVVLEMYACMYGLCVCRSNVCVWERDVQHNY